MRVKEPRLSGSRSREALESLLAQHLLADRVPAEIAERARTPIKETKRWTIGADGTLKTGDIMARVLRLVVPLGFGFLLFISMMISVGEPHHGDGDREGEQGGGGAPLLRAAGSDPAREAAGRRGDRPAADRHLVRHARGRRTRLGRGPVVPGGGDSLGYGAGVGGILHRCLPVLREPHAGDRVAGLQPAPGPAARDDLVAARRRPHDLRGGDGRSSAAACSRRSSPGFPSPPRPP